MPNFQFSDDEINTLLGYLRNMKREVDSRAILQENRDPKTAGEKLFEAYDCYACHRVGRKGRFVGPNLTWVGVRKPQDWEAVWLRDPSAYKPGTFMPNFHLSPDEINALTAFLHSLQGQFNDEARKWESITAFILDARPRVRGRLVAQRLACWSCHSKGLTGGVKNPNSRKGNIPAINTTHVDLGEERLSEIILNGVHAEGPSPDVRSAFSCPSWKEALTDSELADLLAYLSVQPSTIRRAEGTNSQGYQPRCSQCQVRRA